MSAGQAKTPMSTGAGVAVALGIAFACIMLVVVGVGAFGRFIFEHGDHGTVPHSSVVNACDSDIQISEGALGGYPEYASNFPWTRAGESRAVSDSSSISVRALGGPWQQLPPSVSDELVIQGRACPKAPGEADGSVVVARAPMLSQAELVDASVEPAAAIEGAADTGELTTIVAKVGPDQAEEWQTEFAMGPASPEAWLDTDAFPDAHWVASGAFNSVVASGDLAATAYLDPGSGTVAVRIWEWDFDS
jgi:hypothetical protein